MTAVSKIKTSRTGNPIDAYVGTRLRMRRTLLGLTQEMLAEALGLTFQQIQKYEGGANRISASRLHYLSQILGVSVSYFFDDMPENVQELSPGQIRGAKISEPIALTADSHIMKRETLELVRNYAKIADPMIRQSVLDLATSVAG